MSCPAHDPRLLRSHLSILIIKLTPTSDTEISAFTHTPRATLPRHHVAATPETRTNSDRISGGRRRDLHGIVASMPPKDQSTPSPALASTIVVPQRRTLLASHRFTTVQVRIPTHSPVVRAASSQPPTRHARAPCFYASTLRRGVRLQWQRLLLFSSEARRSLTWHQVTLTGDGKIKKPGRATTRALALPESRTSRDA